MGHDWGNVTRIIRTTVVGTALVGSLALGASPAFGQSSSGGAIKVWVTPSTSGSGTKPDPIVITGAIADYGTSQNVNSSGKPAANTDRVKVTLKKGTFMVNTSQLNSALNNAQPTDFNSSNCSASITAGPSDVPIVANSGTGAYSGISGSITMTAEIALDLAEDEERELQPEQQRQPGCGMGHHHRERDGQLQLSALPSDPPGETAGTDRARCRPPSAGSRTGLPLTTTCGSSGYPPRRPELRTVCPERQGFWGPCTWSRPWYLEAARSMRPVSFRFP